MHFQTLQLTQFRNYTAANIELCAGVNCICGPNGAGKTNLLEAIRVLALTRGFHKDRDLILHDADYYALKAGWQHDAQEQTLVVSFDKSRGKKLLLNQQPETRLSDHIGRIPLVALLPDDTVVIKQGGQIRRSWLDMLISQSDKAYLTALIQYNKALKQRNALLKQLADGSIPSISVLEPWDIQLAEYAPTIIRKRADFLRDFQPVFDVQHKAIVETDSPEIVYQPAIDSVDADEVVKHLAHKRLHDLKTGYTTVGPHRDRLQLLLDGHPVRHFGSQGQQKTFLMALKLAQSKRLYELSGQPPILLLDDIYDKLDDNRMRQISGLLKADHVGQVFITDTSLERLQHNLAGLQLPSRFFRVAAGAVAPIENP